MELEDQWCDEAACPDRRKTGQGNIRPYGKVERRYCCTTCRHTFNADKGTFFETIRTERTVVLDAIGMLGERNSLRAIGRLKHCKPDTVLHWLDLAGQHGAAINAHFIHDLHISQTQIDEQWTFVKKSKNTSGQTIRTPSGTCGSGEQSRCPVICVC